MGSCSSSQAQMPIKPVGSERLQKRGLSFEKRQLKFPQLLSVINQTYTSTGKITDFITKTHIPLSMSYLQTKVEQSLQNGKFSDKIFPPNSDSLGKQPYAQKVEWKRASQLLGQQLKIFEGIIQPADIKQGRLGDCYLLSSMAAISQYPFVVKRIFDVTQASTYGYYGWTNIVVDDRLPSLNNRPFFSRAHNGQLWVMLLQKAYAKVFGSYQKIQSGLAGIGLNALTGAPYDYFCKDSKVQIDIEAAWTFITTHLQQQHLLVGSSQNNDRNQYLGLVAQHAYSILQAQQVHVASKKGKKRQRILKLLNPWGKYEWKGRWSDFSDVWSEQLRQQLRFQKADDGIFWINIEDYMENFGQICVCMYNKNYITTTLPLKMAPQQQIHRGVFLRVTARTQGYLTVTQADHRRFGQSYKYSLIMMVLLKADKANGKLTSFIADRLDCDRDSTMKVQLDPGDYYLMIQVGWNASHSRDLYVHFYGQQPISIVEDIEPLDAPSLLDQIVLLHEKHTQKQRIYQYPKDPMIKRVTGSIAGYTYYHYTNKSTDGNYLCESVKLKERKNIQVLDEVDKGQFVVKVCTGQERIVRLRACKQGYGAYHYETLIQFYIVEKYTLEKLKQLADKKPTKIKKREIDGKQIDVRVKTYNYTGGVVLLYQNKLDKYAYIQEISFQIDNLILQNEILPPSQKLQIQLQPNSEKMLSFVVDRPGKQIIFRTKMSFYLNAPQFKF